MSQHLIENAEIVHETYHDDGTSKAILVEAPDFDEPEWMPASAVHDDSPVYKNGDQGDLIVKGHWAEKQGWI